MDLLPLLQKVELFDGLSPDELHAVADLCSEQILHAGDTVTRQGEAGSEIYVICEGWVDVIPNAPPGGAGPRAASGLPHEVRWPRGRVDRRRSRQRPWGHLHEQAQAHREARAPQSPTWHSPYRTFAFLLRVAQEFGFERSGVA